MSNLDNSEMFDQPDRTKFREVPRPGEWWYVDINQKTGNGGSLIYEPRKILAVLDDGLIIKGQNCSWFGPFSVAKCRVPESISIIDRIAGFAAMAVAFGAIFTWGYAEHKYGLIAKAIAGWF